MKKLLKDFTTFLFPKWKRHRYEREKTKIVERRGKQKIFVIGFNKTGTTSVHAALKEFDLIVGDQIEAELLTHKVLDRDYSSLIDYCTRAEAFQDVPFSLPKIYEVLDKYFPDSKFVLTVRDSDEQWFNSISKFHSKLWGINGLIPSEEDLKNANYRYKGFPYLVMSYIFGNSKFYDKKHYMSVYNKHNNDTERYFSGKENFLKINVAHKDSYNKFCQFIGEKPLRDQFGWENKTVLK